MMNPADPVTDEVLIEAIQRGDRDAAADLYERHVDRVHLGPWVLTLGQERSDGGMLDLLVVVELPENGSAMEARFGQLKDHKILTNRIRIKTGQPVIIGYNRESQGIRKTGAMVILPELDSM